MVNDTAALLIGLGMLEAGDVERIEGLAALLQDPTEALKLAAGVRQRIGELLNDAGRLTDEEIVLALAEQAKSGGKFGDVLVRLGFLSRSECDAALAFQRHQGASPPSSEKLRLGRILVSAGDISEDDLKRALERQRATGRRLGDELVAEGVVSADRVQRAVKLQRRLTIAALVATLVPAGALYAKQAKAGQARATMSVSATVVESVTVRALYQAQDLVVSEADIARGYVEVPAASRFEITNKGPCLFEFQATGSVFRSFSVSSPDGNARFGPHGGSLLQKTRTAGTSHTDLNYHFDLAPGVQPGTYRWPVSLSVMPL